MSKKIKNSLTTILKNSRWQIFLILILGFLSITWFRGNYLINSGDFGMPFDWVKYLKSMFSVWQEGISTGMADYRNIASLISYALFGAFMQSLGFSLIFIEKIFFYIWFVGAGLSMYYLCSVLRIKPLGRLASSIFYMFNPFSLIIVWHISHGLIQMPYAFAPLILAFYIDGLRRNKGLIYIFLTCILWTVFTASAYANPRMVILHWLPIFFYFVIDLIFNRQNRVFVIKFSLKFLGVWLAFNFYWLFPFIESITESFSSAHYSVIMSDLETLKLTSVKFFDGLRMMGYWALHEGYKGEPYYAYEAFYRLPVIKVIGWLIPVFVLLGFFHRDVKKKKINLFFYPLVIFFGLIGMSGAYLPLGIGRSLLWLYQTFPSLSLLTRFAFLFFGIPTYLIFAVLFGYGMLIIKEWGRKKIGGVIFLPLAVLFILLFMVLVWPFWNGQVVRSDTKVWPGEKVKIPDYWWEARKWLMSQKDFFRVLPLPMSKTYNVAFDWEQGYSGGDPMRWLSSQPFLLAMAGETKITELIGSLIEREAKFKELDKLLGFLNVKYLLYREDIQWDFLRGHNWWFKQTPENINLFLNQQKDLSLVKEIGKYKFYEVKPEYLLPHIYVPQALTLVSGEAGAFVDIASYLRLDEKEAVIITEQNEDKNNYLENQFNQSFIWQKPILLLKEETEKLSLGEVADSLPYTRILPSSRLYFLIQIKEYFGKLFSPFSKELGLRLTFTGKRLREVYGLLEKQSIPLVPQKSYVVKQINKELVLKTIKRSILEWQIIEKQVGKITDKDFKEKMAEEIKNQVLNQQAFLAALKEELAADQEEYFHSSIAELEKILEDRKQKDIEVDRITSGGNKKINSQEAIYQIEAPQDGQYELYVRDDQMAKYRDLSNNLISFTLDKEEKQERTIEFTDNNLISLGGLYLTKGLHEINLSVPSAYNLISDPSFEEGTWSGAVPMPLNLKSEINATQSADAFQGDFSLKLSSNQNNAVVFTPINNFAYGDIYKVSFAAKYAEGNQPYFGVWENDTESNLPDFNFQKINPRWGTADPQTLFSVLQDLPPDKNWRHYEFIIKPQDSTQSLGLAFFSLQLKVGKTVNLYDDVRVERIFTKPILLKGPLLKEAKNLPNIQFTKLRPTKYQVDVKNATEPYFLVFSESYHPGWQASVEGEHLMINGFANGWFIKKTGDYQIILDFRPQKIYYISMSISVLAFLTAMIFLLSKRRKNEGKK